LVNLIGEREVVKELIQDDFSVANLKGELIKILTDVVYRGSMLQGYDLVSEKLGDKSASDQTADLILEALAKK
jgi:lipid-A-disaccharide synthase